MESDTSLADELKRERRIEEFRESQSECTECMEEVHLEKTS